MPGYWIQLFLGQKIAIIAGGGVAVDDALAGHLVNQREGLVEGALRGVGVARGYLNRPELTAERFLRDPFRDEPQARMYKTGDRGRWLPDGTIEYLGRNDFQVKIRGFRIELGEIEAKLRACDGVREAAVIAREDAPGDKRLVAYVVAEEDLQTSELRTALSAQLPEYMVPSAFVPLEALPLTANGKLDRQALPAPEATALNVREYEAPQGEIEEALAALWQELLQVERVGRRDQFFELGGHSLLVVAMVERLRALGLSGEVRALIGARSALFLPYPDLGLVLIDEDRPRRVVVGRDREARIDALVGADVERCADVPDVRVLRIIVLDERLHRALVVGDGDDLQAAPPGGQRIGRSPASQLRSTVLQSTASWSTPTSRSDSTGPPTWGASRAPHESPREPRHAWCAYLPPSAKSPAPTSNCGRWELW